MFVHYSALIGVQKLKRVLAIGSRDENQRLHRVAAGESQFFTDEAHFEKEENVRHCRIPREDLLVTGEEDGFVGVETVSIFLVLV